MGLLQITLSVGVAVQSTPGPGPGFGAGGSGAGVGPVGVGIDGGGLLAMGVGAGAGAGGLGLGCGELLAIGAGGLGVGAGDGAGGAKRGNTTPNAMSVTPITSAIFCMAGSTVTLPANDPTTERSKKPIPASTRSVAIGKLLSVLRKSFKFKFVVSLQVI